MKILNQFQKLIFLLSLSIFLFSCQDETLNPLSKEGSSSEDLTEDQFNQSHLNCPGGRNIYILVHGAWHPASAWMDVKHLLESAGQTVIAVQLPGLGNDTTAGETITFQDHVNAVKNVVLQQSQPVILVGHSYGGAVVSQVGEYIPEKIKKLVYVSGFMPIDGEMVVNLALSDTASLVTKNLIVEGAFAFLTRENCERALYNVALNSNPFIVSKAHRIIDRCRPQAVATLFEPLHLGANYNGISKAYISCLKDRAVTPEAQRMMYNRAPGIRVFTLAYSDHSPFVTAPFSLSGILIQL